MTDQRAQMPTPNIQRPGGATTVQPRGLHPAAQEAAAVYSEALEQVDHLKTEIESIRRNLGEEVRQLHADLEVEKRHVTELQHMIDGERKQKEHYMRYAVEIRTHLGHIAGAAVKANDLALEMANKPPIKEETELSEKQVDKILKGVSDDLKTPLSVSPPVT